VWTVKPDLLLLPSPPSQARPGSFLSRDFIWVLFFSGCVGYIWEFFFFLLMNQCALLLLFPPFY
jgi:hypothetical protein